MNGYVRGFDRFRRGLCRFFRFKPRFSYLQTLFRRRAFNVRNSKLALFRSAEGDKFYLLATDLSIYYRGGWGSAKATTTGSRDLIIWESTDLVNWSEPRAVAVGTEDAG